MTATPELAPAVRPAATPATDGPARTSLGTLLVLLTGIFVTTLDTFIVNVAIPATQADLHAGAAAVQWMVAGFALAVAVGLITGGRLGDLFGRRRMYSVGLAAFTLTSLVCGLAPSAETLVAARVAQGLSAALLMPQVLGIINVTFTGAHRTRAFTAYGLTMGFGGVFGQLIGGILIQADLFGSGWRSIFLINVPVGLVAVLLTRRLVPESRGQSAATGGARLDLPGTALVTAGLVAVVLPLIEGQQLGWPLWTWLLLGAAPLLLAAFLVRQHRLGRSGGRPLVDLTLFGDRSFAVGSGIALVYALTTAAFFLILALYLQQGRHLTALESGLLFITLGAGYFGASTQAGRVAARLGRQVLAVGALVQALGCAALIAAVEYAGVTGSVGWVVPGMVLVGAGMGLVMAPMSAIVLAGVGPRHAASAAGVLSTAQQVGGALGVAIIGIAFYSALDHTPSYAHAFTIGLLPVIASCLATTALTQLLPRTPR